MTLFAATGVTPLNETTNNTLHSSQIYTTSSVNGTVIGNSSTTQSLSTISTIRISIYAVSLFFGLAGNSLVIITSILQRKQLSRSRFLIAHLSFTDIIFTLRLPLQFKLELENNWWDYGTAWCKIFHGVNSMSMLASIGTMTVIAVERYRGITKPFLAKIKRSTLIYSLIIVWAIAVLTYSPAFALRQVINNRCQEVHPNVAFSKVYSVLLVVIKYILPLSIIGWCYSKIVHAIRKRPKIGEHIAQQKRRRQDDKRIVRLLVVMVIAFAVMTLPASIWWLLYDFELFKSTDSPMQITEILATMVYLHSCVNPIVYFIMDGKFRSDVLDICKCRRQSKKNVTPHTTNNNESASRHVGNFNKALVAEEKSNSEISSTKF
ncbi:neuropeptide Y receptor type 6-like [Rhopilema esculentum]|uniref:neuropeptide Y receptor type 6-like n=1 Tax=Rhopilema esculentum TaxID=499914 RepID=UPI0031D319BE|eukprot:gene15183-6379_t